MTRHSQQPLMQPGTSGQAETDPVPRPWGELPVPKHPANLRKMVAAQQQIQIMLAMAERQEIEGRRFYGKLHLVVKIEGGIGQHVSGFPEFSDRA